MDGGVSTGIIRLFCEGRTRGKSVELGVNLLYNSALCCMFIPIRRVIPGGVLIGLGFVGVGGCF